MKWLRTWATSSRAAVCQGSSRSRQMSCDKQTQKEKIFSLLPIFLFWTFPLFSSPDAHTRGRQSAKNRLDPNSIWACLSKADGTNSTDQHCLEYRRPHNEATEWSWSFARFHFFLLTFYFHALSKALHMKCILFLCLLQTSLSNVEMRS